MTKFRLFGILFIVTGAFLAAAALMTPPRFEPVKPNASLPVFTGGAKKLD